MLDDQSFISGNGTAREQYTPLRHKRDRQKLVVRNKKGDVAQGMCFAFNKNAPGFHLDLQDKKGTPLNRTVHIPFDSIKAVFFVKSFDGRFNPDDFSDIEMPSHTPIAVEFEDGEVIVGRPLHNHWKDEPRFYLVPEKNDTNNLTILIERSAVKTIHDAADYNRKQRHEFHEFIRTHLQEGMSREECMGDYYFSKQDYREAIRQYRIAIEAAGLTDKLKKKACAAQYNLGIHYIKKKDYLKALRMMETVLSLDSGHEQARHKAQQLRTHIAKHPPQT